MKLDNVVDSFRGRPSNFTAGQYLKCLIEHEAADLLNDDTFLDGLVEIRNYLILNEVLPRREADVANASGGKFAAYLKPVTDATD